MSDVLADGSLTVTLSPTVSGVLTLLAGASLAVTITPSPSAPLWLPMSGTTGVVIATVVAGVAWPTYRDDQDQVRPVELVEALESRNIKHGYRTISYERIFYVHGTRETTACLGIGPQPGDPDDMLPLMKVTDRTLEVYARGGGYSNVVKIVVNYVYTAQDQSQGADSEATFTYDFTSDDEHVDVAIAQANYNPAGEDPAAGEERLINFDGTDTNGTDIQSPVLEFSEEHSFPDLATPSHPSFTPEFRRTLRDSVGSVNSVVFREYDGGEVLFIGASAQKRQRTWYVTFRFRARRNRRGIPFTIYNKNGISEPVLVDKFGWQYLWVGVGLRPRVPAVLNKTTPISAPVSVHVSDVYPMIDFAVLGIGVQPLT